MPTSSRTFTHTHIHTHTPFGLSNAYKLLLSTKAHPNDYRPVPSLSPLLGLGTPTDSHLPLPSLLPTKPQGWRVFHFPKVCVSECWLVHLASSRMGWPVAGVGGWLTTAEGLPEDWEGHRLLPSPLPPPAATGCRLWLPSSPMGGCNRGGSQRWWGSTIHTPFLARAI